MLGFSIMIQVSLGVIIMMTLSEFFCGGSPPMGMESF